MESVSRERGHRGLAVPVGQVVVEVEDIAAGMAKPGEGFAVGDMVVGTETGEVVAEAVQLERLGVRELQLLALGLDAFQEPPLCDVREHLLAGPIESVQQWSNPRMHGDEAFVFVLGGPVGPATTDVEHPLSVRPEPDIDPAELLQFSNPHSGIAERGDDGPLQTRRMRNESFDLLSGEAGLGFGFGFGDLGGLKAVLSQLAFEVAPLEHLLADGQGGIHRFGLVGLPDEGLPVAVEGVSAEPSGEGDLLLSTERLELVEVGPVLPFSLAGDAFRLDRREVSVDQFLQSKPAVGDTWLTVHESGVNRQRLLAGFEATTGTQVLGDLFTGLIPILGCVAAAGHSDAVLVVGPATDGDLGALNSFAVN